MAPRTHVSQTSSATRENVAGVPAILEALVSPANATEGEPFDTIAITHDDLDVSVQGNGLYVGCYIVIDTVVTNHRAEITKYEAGVAQIAPPAPATLSQGLNILSNIYGVSGKVTAVGPSWVGLGLTETTAPAYQYVRITTGAARGAVRLVRGERAPGVVDLSESWGPNMPAVGDTYVISGFTHLTTATAAGTTTTVQVDAADESALKSLAYNEHYVGLWLEVVNSTSTNARLQNAAARIVEVTGTATERVFTVSPALPEKVGESSTVRIYAGWSGALASCEEFSEITTDLVSSEADEHGVLECWDLDTTRLAAGDTPADLSGVRYGEWGSSPAARAHGGMSANWAVRKPSARVAVLSFGAGFTVRSLTTRLGVRESMDRLSIARPVPHDYPASVTRAVVMAADGAQPVALRVGRGGGLRVDVAADGALPVERTTPQFQTQFRDWRYSPQEAVIEKRGALSRVNPFELEIHVMMGDEGPGTIDLPADSIAAVRSARMGRVPPGATGVAIFTMRFAPPVDNLLQRAGLATVGNSLEVGYYGTGENGSGATRLGLAESAYGNVGTYLITLTAAAVTAGSVSITLPGIKDSEAAQTFSVEVADGMALSEVARLLAQEATNTGGGPSTPEGFGWKLEAVGDSIWVRTLEWYSYRDVTLQPITTELSINSGATNITSNPLVRVQRGSAQSPEVRELFIGTGADEATSTLTITLDGSANEIALATQSASETMRAILDEPGTDWDKANPNAPWEAYLIQENYIRFVSKSSRAMTGEFSVSMGGTATMGWTEFIPKGGLIDRVENWAFQNSWNVDPCDGTGPSGYVLDPQSFNTYQIEYGNPGTATFSVKREDTGDFLVMHQIARTDTSPARSSPHMYLRAAMSTQAQIDSVNQRPVMGIESWSFNSRGEVARPLPRFSAFNSLTAVSMGTRRTLLLIKHAETHSRLFSVSRVLLHSFSTVAKSAESDMSLVEVVLNPRISQAHPEWTFVRYPESAVMVARSTTVGGTLDGIEVVGGVAMSAAGVRGNGAADTGALDSYELGPGDTLAVVATVGNNTTNFSTSITWSEA